MIICCCTGATDRDIRKAATQPTPDPASGLCASPAGRCCGGCADRVREIVAQVKNASNGRDLTEAARS